MPITRIAPLVTAAVRIDSLDQVGVVVALGDHGTAWVRLADRNEEQFLIEDLTVITPGVARPNTPRRVVLTPAAKHALMGGFWVRGTAAANELAALKLIDDNGITENGDRLASYFAHQTILGKLAKQVREEGIDGEDLADVAAAIDAGEGTGSITGTSIDFQLAFALAASLSDQSAEDLRSDLEEYLGWGPRG